MLTDAQVRLLRQKMSAGKTQHAAAAAAGMSVRSARTWQVGPLPSATPTAEYYRARLAAGFPERRSGVDRRALGPRV